MPHGFELPGIARLTHGTAAHVREPFADVPLRMHELDPGTQNPAGPAFRGPIGFIPFTTDVRLPRHVHRAPDGSMLPERIVVLNGAGLVELAGRLCVIPPGSLVDIAAGVPHSWTACPAGFALPDGSRADGTFLMVYLYAEPTGFSPTASTDIVGPDGFAPFGGDPEAIRIPRFEAASLAGRVAVLWNGALVPG